MTWSAAIERLDVGVVQLELRGSDLRVVLLVCEAHGALHFGGGVDEQAQRIARQRVVVAAGADEVEGAGLDEGCSASSTLEEDALDLVGDVADAVDRGS